MSPGQAKKRVQHCMLSLTHSFRRDWRAPSPCAFGQAAQQGRFLQLPEVAVQAQLLLFLNQRTLSNTL